MRLTVRSKVTRKTGIEPVAKYAPAEQGKAEENVVSDIGYVLQPGETIRYQGSVRWILYLQALLVALVGAVASLLGPPWGWVAAATCFLLAVLLALRAWFIRWTNEIVVTDRRVIMRTASFSAILLRYTWTRLRVLM